MTSAHVPADYVWDSMSHDSSASMPVGGGDIGLNVWAEDGDLYFYISRSGAYDEHSTLLKQGRVRVHIPGESLKPFSQRLKLHEGYCELMINGNKVQVWADVFKPVVHVEIESPRAISPEVSYQSWRYADRPFKKGEGRQNSWKWTSPKNLVTTRDSVSASGKREVTFFHRNPEKTVFDVTVAREGLDSVKSQLWNPLAGLISGGRLKGDNLRFTGVSDGVYDGTDFRSWNFTAAKPAKKFDFTISLHNAQASVADWQSALESVERSVRLRDDRTKSRAWWRDFWDRSYIAAPADGDTAVVRMARNYELFRYMLGCNAYGKEPTKFNGGLFTFDPHHVNAEQVFTPDLPQLGRRDNDRAEPAARLLADVEER